MNKVRADGLLADMVQARVRNVVGIRLRDLRAFDDNLSSREINRLIDASRCMADQSPVTGQLTNELTGLSRVG
jgi:hypothetical protein